MCVSCLCVWVWLVRLLWVIVGEVLAVCVGCLCMGVAGSVVVVTGGEVWLWVCACGCVGGG